jgi:hypothetical protein
MANVVNTVKHPTNLQPVNLNSFIERDVQKYFNNFFDVPIEVSSNIDTAIVGYFETIADNKDAARALASAVIYTSVKQGINPMETLKEFQKLPRGELDAYIAMFLNIDRIGTSFLGVTNSPAINKYVTRTILA